MITYAVRNFPNRQCYLVNLHGESFVVTVTANEIVAEEWANLTMSCNIEDMLDDRVVVSLGLQIQPPRNQGEQVGTLATIQLCVDKRCIIFQYSRAQTVPFCLRQFLLSRACVFVGFQNGYHREILRLSPHEVMLGSNPVDLRMLLIRHHTEVCFCSRERIFERILGYTGVCSTEEVTFHSDWEAETLSEEQVMQACLVARCTYLLGRRMQAWRYR